MSTPRKRLPAAERRESILAAAAEVFGEYGYSAARTDAIAQLAGISQALVIRSFGSKEALFIATAERVVDHVAEAFHAAIAGADERERVESRLGAAYVRLAEDRGALVTLLHLFTLGHHPTIGPIARESFLRIYTILREEAGFSADRATTFLATGMLVSTIFGLRLQSQDHPLAAELLQATFRENTGLVSDLFGG
ncbi:TetR/AcrR family transcriptional regulator [Actinomyces howellii]|uniref:Rut operon repressor n=1 Tax=Actinomyces howellii TaxID=52771 RepID=A0A3S4R4M3_9ACTO|nr:TetR/AcrR family transcriptional regulator [Actinomyces howellii]VEG29583.1 Rut operon repressor [Actinomyces howellii]